MLLPLPSNKPTSGLSYLAAFKVALACQQVTFAAVKLLSKVWGEPAKGVLVSGFLGGGLDFMKKYSKGNMKIHFRNPFLC
jgi:hypothetical protein